MHDFCYILLRKYIRMLSKKSLDYDILQSCNLLTTINLYGPQRRQSSRVSAPVSETKERFWAHACATMSRTHSCLCVFKQWVAGSRSDLLKITVNQARLTLIAEVSLCDGLVQEEFKSVSDTFRKIRINYSLIIISICENIITKKKTTRKKQVDPTR